MKGMTPRRMALAVGGILYVKPGQEAVADTEVESITTDSRKAGEGSLFAAIVGQRVDAHRFIPQVFAQGASCVISEQRLENADGCYIKVQSTLQALKDLAEYYLKVLNIPVVGITGSVGKTSTKEMIASVLAQKYRVLKTEGNFNNELGLPLTVFRLREEHEIAVLEMGISHFGEMHRLARIARPDTAVITNIGQCHLEFLGTRDGILQAKTEIFDFLREDGHIILNGDDDKLAKIKSVNGLTPVRFGLREEQTDPAVDWPEIGYWADQIAEHGFEGVSCRIHTPNDTFDVHIPMPGRHNVMNALAAAAVGETYGLSTDEIRDGIGKIEGLAGRFHIVHTDRYTVIDDCYNANPGSMASSLHVLSQVKGRRVALLGDMGELGEAAWQLHAEVGREAVENGIDVLACAGPLSEKTAQEARTVLKASARPMEIDYFRTRDELLGALPGLLKDGDTILVKASHFMEFDKIVEFLVSAGGGQ